MACMLRGPLDLVQNLHVVNFPPGPPDAQQLPLDQYLASFRTDTFGPYISGLHRCLDLSLRYLGLLHDTQQVLQEFLDTHLLDRQQKLDQVRQKCHVSEACPVGECAPVWGEGGVYTGCTHACRSWAQRWRAL